MTKDITSIEKRNFTNELEFQYSRSSGPGGQHVNKTESKVELRFHIQNSKYLSENDKKVLQIKLKNKINQEGFLIISSQKSKSQIKNKEIIINRFYRLINIALKKRKQRISTVPTKESIEKRIEKKKRIGEKKRNRKTLNLE